jgi:hypothetical protein
MPGFIPSASNTPKLVIDGELVERLRLGMKVDGGGTISPAGCE